MNIWESEKIYIQKSNLQKKKQLKNQVDILKCQNQWIPPLVVLILYICIDLCWEQTWLSIAVGY